MRKVSDYYGLALEQAKEHPLESQDSQQQGEIGRGAL